MGLESYLLSVKFAKPLSPAEEFVTLLQKAGACFLSANSNIIETSSFRNFYFEIRSSLGLTEIHALLAPDDNTVRDFSVRFSVRSPSGVIEQTFVFLNSVAQLEPIRVFDTNNKFKELSLSSCEFRLNKCRIWKRQIVINNKTGLVIEGGDPTSAILWELHPLERKKKQSRWFQNFFQLLFRRE